MQEETAQAPVQSRGRAPNPTQTVSNPRIAKLIELEVAGRIKPEHQQELDTYRAQGLAPKKSSGNSLTEYQGKSTGFFERATGANNDFLSAGEGGAPVGIGGDIARAVLPANVVNSFTSPERQKAQQAKEDFIRASLRYESGAAIGPNEFTGQDKIFFPQTGDSDAVIQQKAEARDRVIKSLKVAAGPGAPTQSIPPGGAGAAGLFENATPDDGTAGKTAVLTSTAAPKPFSTDKDKKFIAILQGAFDGGATADEINHIAETYGYKPYGDDLQTAIDYRDKGGKGARIEAPTSGVENPTVQQKLLAPVLNSTGGALAVGALNGATAGTLDEIGGTIDSAVSGKPLDQAIAEADFKKGLLRENNPIPYGVGEVAGGVGSSIGLGKLFGVASKAGAFNPRAIAADGAYSTAYGAGENNANRGGGALSGAAAGIGGGIAGRGLVNRVAGVVSPKIDPDVAFLRSKGVKTTLGQSLGETAGRVEEKLVSIPGAGDLIRSGRKGALADFNRGFINDGLAPIGAKLPEKAVGPKAMAFAQNAFNRAYQKARSGMMLNPNDAQLAADLSKIDQSLAGGSVEKAVYGRVGDIYEDKILRRIVEAKGNGTPIAGDEYKSMMSELGKIRDSATRSQNFDLADAMRDMSAALDAAARRASPKKFAKMLDKADEGYALFVRAENAARMAGGDTGTFTPSQLDRAVQRGDASVRSKAYLRGDALGQRWSEAGKRVLRDQVPNSGTADRIAAGSMLLGAGGAAAGTGTLGVVAPGALAANAGLAALYAPGVRRGVQALVAGERSKALVKAGDAIRGKAGRVGAAASPLALMYQNRR